MCADVGMNCYNDTLKGSRMLWLYGKENVPSKWIKRFRTLAANTKLKTAKAWAIKELWCDFWKSPDVDSAAGTFKEWYRRRIQHLIQQSCGYRNRERFKRDVFFHLGGLDLYPVQ